MILTSIETIYILEAGRKKRSSRESTIVQDMVKFYTGPWRKIRSPGGNYSVCE